MVLSKFIKNNASEISNFEQNGFKWKKYNNTSISTIPEFKDLLAENNFQEILNREIIVDAFNNGNDFYKAFVLAMMWGGINATRPSKKGDKTTTNFYKALIEGKESISRKIENIVTYVNDNNIEKAYLSMMPGNENQIEGIGESYFTKIFYFIGSNNDNILFKPLIYDKWTKLIHVALLIESAEIDLLLDLYKSEDLKNKILNPKKTDLIYPKTNKNVEAYLDYLKRMNIISTEHNLEAGKLEAFLFGNPLKGKTNNTNLNPRVFVKNYVLNNLVL